MSPILLDTHAAIWAADGKLKPDAAKHVRSAAKRGGLLLSPVTAWEIGLLVRRGRIALSLDVEAYVRAMFSDPDVVIAPVTPAIAVASSTLPGTLHDDPADRLLIATAAELGADLLTRDARIHAYAVATRHIRCVRC